MDSKSLVEETEASDDVLHLVFPYLSTNVLQACACVSSRWKNVADSDGIWTRICLRQWPSLSKTVICGSDGLLPDAKALFMRLHKDSIASRRELQWADFEMLLNFRYKGRLIHTACHQLAEQPAVYPFPNTVPLDEVPVEPDFALYVFGNNSVAIPTIERQEKGGVPNDYLRHITLDVVVVHKVIGGVCELAANAPLYACVDMRWQARPVLAADEASRVCITAATEWQGYRLDVGPDGLPLMGYSGEELEPFICVYGRVVGIRRPRGAEARCKLELLEYAFYFDRNETFTGGPPVSSLVSSLPWI